MKNKANYKGDHKMKSFIVALVFIFGFSGVSQATESVLFRQDTGAEKSIEITLSGTPGTETTITIPSDAVGFKIYPRSSSVRFAVNASPAAVATDSDGTVAATDLAIGGIAKANQWEVRILPPEGQSGTRILKIESATASVVVDFEVF